MKKANRRTKKDTEKSAKEKNDLSKDVGDDDSIARPMPEEIHLRIKEKEIKKC